MFIKNGGNQMKIVKLALFVIAILLIVGYFYLDYLGKQSAYIEVTDVNFTNVPDGEYFGEYKISPVSVKVKSVIKDGEITEVEIIDHYNGLGEKGEAVTDSIIENQSLKVDTISGATASSMAIIKAVEDSIVEKSYK